MAIPVVDSIIALQQYIEDNPENGEARAYNVYPLTLAQAVLVTDSQNLAEYIQNLQDSQSEPIVFDAHDRFTADGVTFEWQFSSLPKSTSTYNFFVSCQATLQTPEDAYRIVGEDIIQFAEPVPQDVEISIRYTKSDLFKQAPDKPENFSPVDKATDVDASKAITLQCSAFNSDYGASLSKVRWCLIKDTNYGFNDAVENVVFENETTSVTTTIPANTLTANTKYLWRCQFIDNVGAKSLWSSYTSFTTA